MEEAMDRFDIVVIGAGAAGEAAGHYAASRGVEVAVVERDLFGGSCAYWACMPSKALLHAAAIHHAGGDYSWSRASKFRDWMINREERDYPDDSKSAKSLERSRVTIIRGTARFTAPGRLSVATDGAKRELSAGAVILAVGSHSKVPHDVPGLDAAHAWTNRQATSTRELPGSLVILGAGPTGVELAQVYARYGVPVTLVHPRDHINDRDHPRSSEIVAGALRRDGVQLQLGVRATRVRAGKGSGGAHIVELSDGTTATGHEILLAIGRDLPLDDLNLSAIGVQPKNGNVERDERLRIADNVYVAGDVAGPELHTHLAHYEGEAAVRAALGDDYVPDLDVIPRAIYTDPEAASVGLKVEQAKERGIDAVELSEDLAKTARGYIAERPGHVTIVVDRATRILVGAFMAGPAASEAIHEPVLAVKAKIPLSVLADTMHAFPTMARVLGTVLMKADREL
jgi:pyruvate/2-oxoglutarate dehydrogenase complex dihydrolipoamide dehydrogenase (E3) component